MNEINKKLIWAARCGYLKDLNRYLDLGANPNVTANEDLYGDIFKGCTPLIAALKPSSTDCLEALIKHGANVDKVTEIKGKLIYPIKKAAQSARYFHLKALVNAGADLSVVDEKGENILMHAVNKFTDKHWPIVHYLLYNGIEINNVDEKGNSALLKALSTKNIHNDLTRFLIVNGADVIQANHKGVTPLLVAQKFNHKDALNIIESVMDQMIMNALIEKNSNGKIEETTILSF